MSMKPRVAVLVTGTYREIEFLLRLFPHMAGQVEHDIFLVLRHVHAAEVSRLEARELDFKIRELAPLLDGRISVCELPSIDPAIVESKYLIPVGPAGAEREIGQLSMFHGVSIAISMMKAAMRGYTHVMKTRTDYLPWVAPWVSGMLDHYEESGRKIIVDGLMTRPQRYPDRPDIPWQGSISDLFCFASVDQFLTLWDIEEILPKVWTGVPETTLFRAATARFRGDHLQSRRRNNSLLNHSFVWEPNDGKESRNILRPGVLPAKIKQSILQVVEGGQLPAPTVNVLIRISYDSIAGMAPYAELKKLVTECMPSRHAEEYLSACRAALPAHRPTQK